MTDTNSRKTIWLAVSLLAALTLSLLAGTVLAQQQRIALLIGNGGYQGGSWLANPVNDARLMQRTLQGLGFDASIEVDLDQGEMEAAIEVFRSRLRSAGPDGVGLFFYAGHGIQFNNNNYLIPLAHGLTTEESLERRAINAQNILQQLQETGAGFTMMILDACRDNPFYDNAPANDSSLRRLARRITEAGGQPGFARMGSHNRVLIAYSAAPSQQARDRVRPDDRNSPYTRALVEHMTINRPEPLDLARVFARTADAVHQVTGGTQLPWIEGSPPGTPFYFQQPREPGFYLAAAVEAGQRITRRNVEVVRAREIPDAGGHIRLFEEIRGGCYARAKMQGAPLVWEDISASCPAQ